MSQTEIDKKEVSYHTISLSPSYLFPVSLKLKTINSRFLKMFATTSSKAGIEPGSSVIVTERYYLLTSDQASVISSLHRQTDKGPQSGDQWNYVQWRHDLWESVLWEENMVQWGSNEETPWKFPQISKDINLIINLFRQNAASISTETGDRSNYIICYENQNSRTSMRPHFLEGLLRASSSEVPPPTSKTEPACSMSTPREHSGRLAGGPDSQKIPS